MERLKPKQVDIEVTNVCNLKCKLCPGLCNTSFHQGFMSFDFFKMVVDKIDFDCSIVPWLNGEPLLNPDYHKMLAYLSEKKLPYYTTTNMTVWRDDVFFELLKKGSSAYQLIISLDGLWGNGNISKARPGSNEQAIRMHIDMLLKLKKELNSDLDIAVKICERGQDWGEIEKYIQHWLNIEGINFVVLGKPLKGENEISMRTQPCQYSDRNFMVIRWDGTLIMCAYNEKVANDLMLSYGKVTPESNLLDLYNNRFITAFREDQRNGIYPEPCDKCTFAYTGQGFQGSVLFREDPSKEYYFHQDYYNSFFSKVKKWKPISYYGQ